MNCLMKLFRLNRRRKLLKKDKKSTLDKFKNIREGTFNKNNSKGQ